MSRLRSFIIAFSLLAAAWNYALRSGAELTGSDDRTVDPQQRENVIRIIQYHMRTRAVIKPLLMFSPFSDPDVLGGISVDDGLELPLREAAANAMLDQLYLANPYYQGVAEFYIDRLVESPERSLRLKGWLGRAILEYRRFGLPDDAEESHRLLQLLYSASQERDPRLRQLLDELSAEEPSALIGEPAWTAPGAEDAPYRQFDAAASTAGTVNEEMERTIAAAWKSYKTVTELLAEYLPADPASKEGKEGFGGGDSLTALRNLTDMELHGFLSRLAAISPMYDSSAGMPAGDVAFFRDAAYNSDDPYLRALALWPMRFATAEAAVNIFFDFLSPEHPPLVRVAAAAMLSGYVSDRGVRSRIMAAYQEEGDERVRVHMLRSLVEADPLSPAPDVQAFLISQLREEKGERPLEFIVHVLGAAKVRSASAMFSRLLATSENPLLRARIADALTRIGFGSRLRTLQPQEQ